MSLDLMLKHNPCITCLHSDDSLDFNYTYNASKMWCAIYPDEKNMVYIEGLTGQEAEPKIRYAIDYMVKHRRQMLQLEPPNGWGSYSGFLEWLTKVHAACLLHPNSIWSACR